MPAIMHLHQKDAPNSQAACGKVFMSLLMQDSRMTYQVARTTCTDCLAAIPQKFR